MSTLNRAVATGLLVLSLSVIARAQDVQAWRNASAWDVVYEVSFKSATEGTRTLQQGSMTYTATLDVSFSAATKLDLRSDGASLSMLKMTSAPGVAEKMSTPEYQAKMMELVSRTDQMANWMNSGMPAEEYDSDSAMMAAGLAYLMSTRGPARLDYLLVEKGVNLVNEVGQTYNQTTTTTRKGAGKVRPNGTPTFEIDADAKTYLLSLPYSFTDDSSTSVKVDVVAVSETKGDKPFEEKTTNENSLNAFPGRIVIDDPNAKVGDMLMLEGILDPAAGKLVGEQSIKGHYEEGATIAAGTFVFRYTLTPH